MADIKISQLGSAIAVDDSDIVPVVSGGNTLKATAAQLKEHAIGNTSISGIGNGSVTGAISALNTDKQPKTLATAITVDGTEQTTVEGALGAINTDLGSTKQALTNISITGTTNNTGSIISAGKYFYHNGTLTRAKADIYNGETITSSNSEDALGGLNNLFQNLTTFTQIGSAATPKTANTEFEVTLSENLNNFEFIAVRYMYSWGTVHWFIIPTITSTVSYPETGSSGSRMLVKVPNWSSGTASYKSILITTGTNDIGSSASGANDTTTVYGFMRKSSNV